MSVLGDRDLFELWRLVLGTICTVYAAVVTGRSLWRWYEYLAGSDRRTSLLRRYTMVQLLRLRLSRFSWDFVRIGFWVVALIVVLGLHAS